MLLRAKWIFSALALCAVGACARTPAAVIPPPRDTLSVPDPLLPPATDLTGEWTSGTGEAPATPLITLHPPCTHHPAMWLVRQTGNRIEVWAFEARYDQGIVSPGPGPARMAPSTGWISAHEVTMDDGSYRYVLSYDPESKQLRGTRDGTPFWMVRQAVIRPSPCPGVP